MALQSLTIRLPEKGERVFRHRGTRADLGVIAQMFESQDYSFGRLRRGAEPHTHLLHRQRVDSRPVSCLNPAR